MPRIAACNLCLVLQRMPDIPKDMPLIPARIEFDDGFNYVYKDDTGLPVMVAAFDPVLEDFVEKHSHGREDRDVISGVIQTFQVDQRTWDTMDVVTKIREDLHQSTNNWYEERDEYKDAALKCYNAHGNPDTTTGCRDYLNDDRRIGHAHYTDDDGRVVTIPDRFRQYLCYMCPFQQSYIQVELRRRRGLYADDYTVKKRARNRKRMGL